MAMAQKTVRSLTARPEMAMMSNRLIAVTFRPIKQDKDTAQIAVKICSKDADQQT